MVPTTIEDMILDSSNEEEMEEDATVYQAMMSPIALCPTSIKLILSNNFLTLR